jgi:hypothetical protein
MKYYFLIQTKKEHDLVLRLMREKDTFMKFYARLEITVANIKLSIPTLQKQADDLKRQRDQIKADEIFYKKQMNNIHDEIDRLTVDFIQKDRMDKTQSDALHEQLILNRKVSNELEEKNRKCVNLIHTVEQIKIECDLKARELTRLKNKYRSLSNDFSFQEMAVINASKRAEEAEKKFGDFQNSHDEVKNEKNRLVSLNNLA